MPSVIPLSIACPQGRVQMRSAYLTSVAVYSGLPGTCRSTLPSSPSSHFQSQSWCRQKSSVLSRYIVFSGQNLSATMGMPL